MSMSRRAVFILSCLKGLNGSEYGNQSGMRACDAFTSVWCDDKGVFDTNHPHAFHAFLGFNGKHHSFGQRFVKALGNHRNFVDGEADAMP